ncbi:Glutamate racemase [Polaribacter huanghezhanensis]|uniref:glutamate racemase n=1 Tax=Polaribacter huanghezhanensis TaxID=1354726 RepID=UPI002648964D|nr:glutamate racemase [Polaribacter huanghezhanensis]WKD85040.1 Glutamate racemase [Polaribacter huanghezhanensis]
MNAASKQPIGIFDSGIGGTSIWKKIHQFLPNENTIYLADSKNAPYGQKSENKILELSIKNTEFLLNKNCKLIVVACNTATTNAIEYLREHYAVPFIGIEPAIKPAAINTKTKNIGILATKGTLNSRLFTTTSNTINQEVFIREQVGEGLVELIEDGQLVSTKMTHLLTNHLHKLLKYNIDYLVLGCTHYPYLIPQIQKIIGTDITIIDSGLAVAKQTKKILEENNLLNTQNLKTKHFFFTNKTTKVLEFVLGHNQNCIIEKLNF